MTDRMRPGAMELWRQAGGGTPDYDKERYLELMREEGLLIPAADLPEGDDGRLACGWTPNG